MSAANNITGVLLIDCWEPREDQAAKIIPWHKKIVSYCNTLDLKCVVNSAYNCLIDYDIYNNGDRSQYNTMRIYNGLGSRYTDTSRGTGSDFDIAQRGNRVMEHVLQHALGMNKTSITIKQLTMSKPSIFLLTAEDLEHHWHWYLDQQVKNWFVIGQTWQLCTHQRPIGFLSLKEMSRRTGCKFYTAPWAILDENQDPISKQHFETDTLRWEFIDNLGYYLVP